MQKRKVCQRRMNIKNDSFDSGGLTVLAVLATLCHRNLSQSALAIKETPCYDTIGIYIIIGAHELTAVEKT